jgi:hypothetical protein
MAIGDISGDLVYRRRKSPGFEGFFAFVMTFLACAVLSLVATYLIGDKPKPWETEAYETIGYAIQAMFIFVLGLVISFVVALIVAVQVGVKTRKANEAQDQWKQMEHDHNNAPIHNKIP